MRARPLADPEYDHLAGALDRFYGEGAMNLEQLDGFFAALICGPDAVSPSEYLPEIWGGDMADEEAFSSRPQLKDFLDLVMRHWSAITDTLQSGDVHLPLLLEDENGCQSPIEMSLFLPVRDVTSALSNACLCFV